MAFVFCRAGPCAPGAQRGHPVQYAPGWMGQKKSIERKMKKFFLRVFPCTIRLFRHFHSQKGKTEFDKIPVLCILRAYPKLSLVRLYAAHRQNRVNVRCHVMEGADKKTPGLSKEQKYEFGNGKVSFIVTPIFRKDGKRTVATALLWLMKQETER